LLLAAIDLRLHPLNREAEEKKKEKKRRGETCRWCYVVVQRFFFSKSWRSIIALKFLIQVLRSTRKKFVR
jgi:hypothetical protein